MSVRLVVRGGRGQVHNREGNQTNHKHRDLQQKDEAIRLQRGLKNAAEKEGRISRLNYKIDPDSGSAVFATQCT